MLSLVVPVYKNQGSIPDLLQAIAALHGDLGGRLEAVFVVDGSPDRCYEILRDALPGQVFESQLILLSRNFGSFAAIRVGLQYGRGDLFAVMAADLQEPPSLVRTMETVLKDEQVDVVVGVRESRDDSLGSRLPANLFWALYRRYVVPEVPPGGVDIFGCNRAFRDTLLTLEERHSSLIAQIFWLGFKRKFIPYTRQKRQHGKSAWTLQKKINYLLDSVFAFTDLPIKILTRVGGFCALVAGLLGLFVAAARLGGYISVPGYAMTIIAIFFLGAVNLFAIGIVGSYAWRTYENTKRRPLAIPMSIQSFNQ